MSNDVGKWGESPELAAGMMLVSDRLAGRPPLADIALDRTGSKTTIGMELSLQRGAWLLLFHLTANFTAEHILKGEGVVTDGIRGCMGRVPVVTPSTLVALNTTSR